MSDTANNDGFWEATRQAMEELHHEAQANPLAPEEQLLVDSARWPGGSGAGLLVSCI